MVLSPYHLTFPFLLNISYTVGVYIFMCAAGNLLWAPYASFCQFWCLGSMYGRGFSCAAVLPVQTVVSRFTWPLSRLFAWGHYMRPCQRTSHSSSLAAPSRPLGPQGMHRHDFSCRYYHSYERGLKRHGHRRRNDL